MATVTKTGCALGFDLQSTNTITSTTFLTNQTQGIYCSSISFSGTGYLSPNVASYDCTFSIKLVGSTSGTIVFYSKKFTSDSPELYSSVTNVLGTINLSSIQNAALKGNITLVISFSYNNTTNNSVWIGFTDSSTVTLTYATKPSVQVGEIITKAQMDSLRAYKNNTPTATTQYNTIIATIGSTYNSNITQNSIITASQYNA